VAGIDKKSLAERLLETIENADVEGAKSVANTTENEQ